MVYYRLGEDYIIRQLEYIIERFSVSKQSLIQKFSLTILHIKLKQNRIVLYTGIIIGFFLVYQVCIRGGRGGDDDLKFSFFDTFSENFLTNMDQKGRALARSPYIRHWYTTGLDADNEQMGSKRFFRQQFFRHNFSGGKFSDKQIFRNHIFRQ